MASNMRRREPLLLYTTTLIFYFGFVCILMHKPKQRDVFLRTNGKKESKYEVIKRIIILLVVACMHDNILL